MPVIADLILDSLGMSRKKIQANQGQIIRVDLKQIPAIIRDGQADLYFDAVPLDYPAITEISLISKVRFLVLLEKTIQHLSLQSLIPSNMPKAFKGQTRQTRSVDLGTMIIAHQDLSNDLAYLAIKTICESASTMAQAHKAWSITRQHHGAW